jgi:hypothetical protein
MMEDLNREALLEFLSTGGQGWVPERAGARGESRDRAADPPEWVVILGCLRRIRGWRVPPHWSSRDWNEEIRAEAVAAALQAMRDFDQGRGIPREMFLRRRVMSAALNRYRREWSFAISRASETMRDCRGSGTIGAPGLPSRDVLGGFLQEALRRLPRVDAWLIEGLFWDGKSEAKLAESLGISQQAVNKRKRSIFKTLHRLIDSLAKNTDFGL